ncbi:MAG: hypothetical protein HY462_00485 [Parcubacteria group bacterium]|nr:hypothetical protein [Parcubacteria group bacterium]
MLASWDRISRTLFALSALVLGFVWFLAVWRWRLAADFIPLHYTIYFGLDRFGPKSDLALFPALGSVIFGVNAVLAEKLFAKNQFGRLALLALTLLLVAVLLASFVLIILKTLY